MDSGDKALDFTYSGEVIRQLSAAAKAALDDVQANPAEAVTSELQETGNIETT